MELPTGVYRIVSGNGGGINVEVRADLVFPADPRLEVRGEILVKDLTFNLNRWDEPLKLCAGLIKQGDEYYSYTVREYIKPWPAARSD